MGPNTLQTGVLEDPKAKQYFQGWFLPSVHYCRHEQRFNIQPTKYLKQFIIFPPIDHALYIQRTVNVESILLRSNIKLKSNSLKINPFISIETRIIYE